MTDGDKLEEPAAKHAKLAPKDEPSVEDEEEDEEEEESSEEESESEEESSEESGSESESESSDEEAKMTDAERRRHRAQLRIEVSILLLSVSLPSFLALSPGRCSVDVVVVEIAIRSNSRALMTNLPQNIDANLLSTCYIFASTHSCN
jgi:chromatin remodeling complex protein RSC6